MRGRYYSPTWHRFVNSDQGVDANQKNQFAYVNGNPLSLTDPSGMMAMIEGRSHQFAITYWDELYRNVLWSKFSDLVVVSVGQQPLAKAAVLIENALTGSGPWWMPGFMFALAAPPSSGSSATQGAVVEVFAPMPTNAEIAAFWAEQLKNWPKTTNFSDWQQIAYQYLNNSNGDARLAWERARGARGADGSPEMKNVPLKDAEHFLYAYWRSLVGEKMWMYLMTTGYTPIKTVLYPLGLADTPPSLREMRAGYLGAYRGNPVPFVYGSVYIP